MANVDSADLVRATVGFVLIAIPFMLFDASFLVGWGGWKLLVTLMGVVLLGTAAMRFSPLYAICGANTLARERR